MHRVFFSFPFLSRRHLSWHKQAINHMKHVGAEPTTCLESCVLGHRYPRRVCGCKRVGYTKRPGEYAPCWDSSQCPGALHSMALPSELQSRGCLLWYQWRWGPGILYPCSSSVARLVSWVVQPVVCMSVRLAGCGGRLAPRRAGGVTHRA